MLEALIFLTVLFTLIIIVVIIVNAIISLIAWGDLSEILWKDIGKMSLFFGFILLCGFIIFAALEITKWIL